MDLAGAVVTMPTSRGSCSRSGVVLELALADRAPAALIFAEPEDVATLGALLATQMFGQTLHVLRLAPAAYAILAEAQFAEITDDAILADGLARPLHIPSETALGLSALDRERLAGNEGDAAALAKRLDTKPDATAVRRAAVEHVFGTLKGLDGRDAVPDEGAQNARTEMSLAVLTYNM